MREKDNEFAWERDKRALVDSVLVSAGKIKVECACGSRGVQG